RPLPGGGALRRTEGRAGTGRSTERIVYVGHPDDVDRSQAAGHRTDIDPVEGDEARSPVGAGAPLDIQARGAERGRHPDAHIVRRRSTEADEQPTRAGLE